jgi:hypothetical protein
MNQELQLGKYEFYPNDRIQQLFEEILFELRQFRRSRRFVPEYSDDELDRLYKEMAEDEAVNPNCFGWLETEMPE